MKTNNKNKFIKIISTICKIKQQEINLNKNISDYKELDSLNNIRLILELNKAYKKKIKIEKLEKIKTLSELYRIVNE
jgi:acyl carrier protein